MRLGHWARRRFVARPRLVSCLGSCLVLVLPTALAARADAQTRASAPDSLGATPRVELFGQLVTDLIHDFDRNDPRFYDVMRPSKLPAFANEFGEDGHTWFSVRPSRVGLRITWPTSAGEARGIFDWDLFAGGGRTDFDLVRAYFQLGNWGAGQYDSPFMDIDVFPNSIEFWGPNAIIFFRNIQVRYMPVRGDSRVTIALERPGASADRNDVVDPDGLADQIDFADAVGRYPWPDLSADGRYGGDWGHVELAGILRGIYWDDRFPNDSVDLSGKALGWGLSLSSKLRTTKRDALKLQVSYGEAIQSYLDAPFDVGVERRVGDPRRPFVGVPLPVLAGFAFYDHGWNDRFTTALGWSGVRVTNSDAQSPIAFRTGQYALVNLLYTPAPDLLVGGEVQWGRRTNFRDAFTANDVRIQLTARLNYSVTILRDKEKDDGK